MVKNKNEHPFAKLLEKLSSENPRLKTIFFYEDNSGSDAKQGLVCIDTVQQQLSEDKNDAQYFFCGPKEFMLSIHEKLLKNGIREKIFTMNSLAQKQLKTLNLNR